jgi:hypothetical protein
VGRCAQRLALLTRLLGQNQLVRVLAFGRQLIEAQAHARNVVGPRRVALAHPGHRTKAHQQRRAIRQREVELQGGPDFDRLLGANEEAAWTHINAIAVDEIVQRRALELDAKCDRVAIRA